MPLYRLMTWQRHTLGPARTGEVRLVPKTAWMINSAGCVVFLAVLIGTMVTGTKDTELRIGSVVGVVCLLWFAVICARPPSVHVFADRLVVARFGKSRIISQKDFCSVGLRQSQRIIGGDSNDSSKHVFISYYDQGDLVTIPAIWCDLAMGLLTRSEWQRFNAVLTAWADGKLGVATS